LNPWIQYHLPLRLWLFPKCDYGYVFLKLWAVCQNVYVYIQVVKNVSCSNPGCGPLIVNVCTISKKGGLLRLLRVILFIEGCLKYIIIWHLYYYYSMLVVPPIQWYVNSINMDIMGIVCGFFPAVDIIWSFYRQLGCATFFLCECCTHKVISYDRSLLRQHIVHHNLMY